MEVPTQTRGQSARGFTRYGQGNLSADLRVSTRLVLEAPALSPMGYLTLLSSSFRASGACKAWQAVKRKLWLDLLKGRC
jgi:hypothetical protein